jgi:hypothetical protein
MWLRRRLRNEEPAANGGVSKALKVMLETSSPLTGEDGGRGERTGLRASEQAK